MPVAAQVAVRLGFFAGLAFALESLRGRAQEFFHFLQAFLLGGLLQDLLPDLGFELDPAGDGKREVSVGRLYLDAY